MFEIKSLALLKEAVAELSDAFSGLPDYEPSVDLEGVSEVLKEVTERLHDNFPYFHPFYAGQMLKPPHPVARLAYALSMFINPNNHSLDGGRASSAMEKEAVGEIARMFGWVDFMGHLTSGGTMANLEALWISRCLRPDKKVVASEQSHFTHERISEVLKIDYEAIPVDHRARMDMDALESRLRHGDVGTVVCTMGTTGAGAVDPLHDLVSLQKKYEFRIHVDAAYGGYFALCREALEDETRLAFDCMSLADSIVIDPHKHGLQPYGCGCVLFRDPRVGVFYKHDSPYTYFSSQDLHLGEITLECSRAGASAVALWATQKMMPLIPDGEFAWGLRSCREAAEDLYGKIVSSPSFLTIFHPELDILIWSPAETRVSEISRLSQRHFKIAAERGLHLALVNLPSSLVKAAGWGNVEFDQGEITCLRSCLMKWDHKEWVEEIWNVLKHTTSHLT